MLGTVKMYPQSSCELIGNEIIKNYLLGGKAVVTLESPSGEHHTYAVNQPNSPDIFPDGTFFIYCQIDSGLWLYVGMIEDRYSFRLTRASNWGYDSKIVKGARYIVRMMNGLPYDSRMKLYHAGVCSVCGRQLTTPKSIKLGIGPKCRKKIRGLS